MSHKNVPIPPDQYASYAMARLLILLAEWQRIKKSSLEEDRAALFDFILRQPRQVAPILPGLKKILEVNDLHEGDLSDLFAKQQLGNYHEEFNTILTSLIARGLVDVSSRNENDPNLYIILTEDGSKIAGRFISRLGFVFREIAEFLISEFSKKDPAKLVTQLRTSLPDQSLAISWLSNPIEVQVNGEETH